MRLNNNDLRQIFISNIKENIHDSEMACPSPKQLLRLFRTKKYNKRKSKIIDHITNCYYCAHEFEFVIKALRYEKEMDQIAKEIITTKKIKRASLRLSWRFGSIFAGIFIVCILISALIIAGVYNKSKYRTLAPRQIELNYPRSAKIHKSDLFFRWEILKGTEHYVFELYDETLYQIWKSEKIMKNSFNLPDSIVSQLETNKTYFWMISAVLPSGIIIESRLKEIFVTD